MSARLASVVLVIAVAAMGCGARVTEDASAPSSGEPNGYCETDDDCAPTDFCMVEWCLNGPGCEAVNRCTMREDPGVLCESDRWCKPGLTCSASTSVGGVCASAAGG